MLGALHLRRLTRLICVAGWPQPLPILQLLRCLPGGVDSSEAAEVPEPPAGVPVPKPLSGSSGDPSPPLPGLGVPPSPALASGLDPIAQPFPSSGLDPITQPFPSKPPEQSPLHPAEALAASLLGGTTVVTEADLLRVHALLPRERPSRGSDLGNPGFSFSCGCYGKGGLAGLRRNTLVYPLVTKLLTSHVLKRFPGKCFSAVSIFENVRALPCYMCLDWEACCPSGLHDIRARATVGRTPGFCSVSWVCLTLRGPSGL